MDPDDAGSAENIDKKISESVAKILEVTPTGKTATGQERLLLIDIVQEILNRWCKIFPFCR